MRFSKSGPDVPDRLVQMHEDGGVVFFCGAGISYPAGLPGFQDLVKKIVEGNGEALNRVEQAAMDEKRFDATLDLLERRIGPAAMRTQLWRALQPKLELPGATSTHEALLSLGRSKNGVLRLITTNFDRLFHAIDPGLLTFSAPLLPVPKPTVWDGLVYLHGLLPETDADAAALSRLIVTSGDFGRAYLTERWASRFVSELFRQYSVCFVGYSIGDPVLRYMLDAISADRERGEAVPEMYAFGSSTPMRSDKEGDAWKAKGVTPILYNSNKRLGHRHLHETIRQWSEDYRDGRNGQIATVRKYARSIPSKVRGDHVVERMLWAITDRTGLAAREFASLDPAPSIEWLSVFSEPRYETHDLPRFGVLPSKVAEAKVRPFSVFLRPAPYFLSSYMAIVESGARRTPWDRVVYYLADWLSRNLGEQALMSWVLQHGGQLHPTFRDMVRQQLPKSELSPALRKIWMVLSSDQVMSGRTFGRGFLDVAREANALGWAPSVQREFLKLLSPMVSLSRPLRLVGQEQVESRGQRSVRELVNWSITLIVGAHPQHSLQPVLNSVGFAQASIEMLPMLTNRLKEAMDLSAQLEGASELSDLSYIHRPSIANHPQNKEYEEWTLLITLCRDAWIEADRNKPSIAKAALEHWRSIDYPVFRRLAFFAAAVGDGKSGAAKIDLLLERGGWWLWSPETQREAFRLLESIARTQPEPDATLLLDVIMKGPPRGMFRAEVENEEWERIVLQTRWVRLAKLREFGLKLSKEAQDWLATTEGEKPGLRLQADDRDEFPYFMSVGHGPQISWRKQTSLPLERGKLVHGLTNRPLNRSDYEDDWSEICQKAPKRAITALMQLAKDKKWQVDVWNEAFQAFADDKAIRMSWVRLNRHLLQMPDAIVVGINETLSAWIKRAARYVGSDIDNYIELVRRIVDTAQDGGGDPQHPVTAALNHPVGKVTDGLLNWWYTTNPQVNGGLPQKLEVIFSELTEQQGVKYRRARTILAAHVHPLFLVAPGWARTHLLPWLSWESNAIEAKSTWAGYLRSPRISPQLLDALKDDFVATAAQYANLGSHDEVFAGFFTYVAVELRDHFSIEALRTAFNALPAEALGKSADALRQMIIDAEGRREDVWRIQIRQLLTDVWPKSRDRRSADESIALALVAIHSGDFQDAFKVVRTLLSRAEHPFLPVLSLRQSELPERHPRLALDLMDAIVSDDAMPDDNLRSVLNRIQGADGILSASPSYRRLDEILQRMMP